MRYYIIAGEKSGDLHGGNLIRSIKKLDSKAKVRAWGGDDMQSAGAELVTHYREMAFMGFLEVLKNARFLKRKIQECKQDILTFNPDALVLIDYAGFNLRIAKFAKASGIPVHYYISPKVWAWNQKRAYKIKQNVDHLYSILPFEKDFFDRFGMHVDYVGNPLLDAIKAYKADDNFKFNCKDFIAILPGSRKQEVANMLENMLSVCKNLPEEQFIVAKVSNLDHSLYAALEKQNNVHLIENKTYDILANAKAAIVTSGTATLETALFFVPQVVCYKTSAISYSIGKRLIKVNYISLVNLILDKKAVTELIQSDFNPKTLLSELVKILPSGEKRAEVLNDYKILKTKLGDQNTSDQVASYIFHRTNSNN